MALVIVLLTPVVLLRTPTDIFPNIDIPVISLVWTFTGLEPQEMEQRITGNVERGIATLVNDVEHTESQSLNGVAVINVYFQPSMPIFKPRWHKLLRLYKPSCDSCRPAPPLRW